MSLDELELVLIASHEHVHLHPAVGPQRQQLRLAELAKELVASLRLLVAQLDAGRDGLGDAAAGRQAKQIEIGAHQVLEDVAHPFGPGESFARWRWHRRRLLTDLCCRVTAGGEGGGGGRGVRLALLFVARLVGGHLELDELAQFVELDANAVLEARLIVGVMVAARYRLVRGGECARHLHYELLLDVGLGGLERAELILGHEDDRAHVGHVEEGGYVTAAGAAGGAVRHLELLVQVAQLDEAQCETHFARRFKNKKQQKRNELKQYKTCEKHF